MFEAMKIGNSNITIIRKTVDGYTKHNLPKYETEEIELVGLFNQGGSKQSDAVNRDEIITEATIYLPSGTLIEDTDSFIIDGLPYEKIGDPVVTVSPFLNFPPVPVMVKVRKSDG